MAVGNISGPLLTANLLRNGKDLAFETDLLFLNVSDPNPQNFKVGIGTSNPSYLLDISGITRSTNIKSTEVDIGNINVKLNTISSSIGDLTIQTPANGKLTISTDIESTYNLTVSGSTSFNSAANKNQSFTTSGTGTTTISSGALGTINNLSIGNTSPSTGNFTLITVGTEATTTRFPNAKIIISDTAQGIQQNETHNIGLLAEATAGATNVYGVGIYGVAYTSSTTQSRGVVGEAHVADTSNTQSAIGVLGYSQDPHTGGANIGLYARAENGASNYALYMAAGNIKNQAAQTWELGGNLTFSGNYSITIPTLALTNPLPVTSGGTGVTTSTGTTHAVLSNNPVLVAPTLGDATATTINKVIISSVINTASLTLADNSSLTTVGSNTLSITTTGNTSVTLPTTGLLVNNAETTLSSLSSVGTITTGTWSGLFGSVTGANLTNLTAANLTGTIPSNVLGNSSIYLGSTQIALNRASSGLTLADVHFGTTDVSTSFTIPVGTTSTRPATPDAGNIRYNTDTNNYEGYNGNSWNKVGSGLTPTPLKTSLYNSTEAQLVRCNSQGGSFSINLPVDPVDGCIVGIIDATGYFNVHPVSVIPSLNTTVEYDATSVILDVVGAYVTFIYVEFESNWKIQETPNMLSDYHLAIASTTSAGAVRVDGNTIIINSQGVISAVTSGTTTGAVLSVIGSSPIISSGGTTPTISIQQASAVQHGYLSSTDWNTFNSKLSSVPIASPYTLGGIKVGVGLTIDSNGILSSTGAVVVPTASASTVGGIRVGTGLSIDANSILNTDDFVRSVIATLPLVTSSGSDPIISILKSSASVNGYLSSVDWNTFNNKLSSVPMASANVLGGVKIGSGLSIDNFGILSATSAYTLPIASDITLGGVRIDGTTITINQSGAISSYGKLVLQVFSSSEEIHALTIDADIPGPTNQLVLDIDESIIFTGLIIAKEQASANVATYTIRCTAVNNNGTISIVSSLITNIDNTIGLAIAPTLSVDSTNNAIKLSSGAKILTNIKWTAILDLATATFT